MRLRKWHHLRWSWRLGITGLWLSHELNFWRVCQRQNEFMLCIKRRDRHQTRQNNNKDAQMWAQTNASFNWHCRLTWGQPRRSIFFFFFNNDSSEASAKYYTVGVISKTSSIGGSANIKDMGKKTLRGTNRAHKYGLKNDSSAWDWWNHIRLRDKRRDTQILFSPLRQEGVISPSAVTGAM